MSRSEIQNRADFTRIRYAQCWEDSRLLRKGLEPEGKRCLSIGAAGDNSFALLAAGAAHVTAVEMNPAQIACIELRRAAYLKLDHGEFLELLGSRPSAKRMEWYRACRPLLPAVAQDFWDAKKPEIEQGVGSAGKFERYFSVFRRWILPLAHSRREITELLRPRDSQERSRYYREVWDNRRWRGIFRCFFSRSVMGALGRDPEFFKYVEGSVADRILDRTRYALETLDPSENPYLHWILTGTHGTALPEALEESRFSSIREALIAGKFDMVEAPIEAWLESGNGRRYDAYNLSDIFEYMSEASTAGLLAKLADSSRPGARLAYWNMLAPRSRPEAMADRLLPHNELADRLFGEDRAFFYSRFVIEEVLK